MRILSLFVVFITTFLSLSAQETIKIKAVGDLMLGSFTPRKIIPKNPAKTFGHLSEYFKDCDFAFGNLEGTFIKEGMKPCKCSDTLRKLNQCFEFGMPHYLVNLLKLINLNIVNRDNNHSMDYGRSSFEYTSELLNEVSIFNLMPQKNIIIDIKGIKVGFIPFGFSNISNKIQDFENAQKLIKELKKSCNIVIVSFHGGKEGKKALNIKNENENFLGSDRGNLIKFSKNAIDAGADLVLGHGPHVIRTLELYKGKLIAYSLGNFLTYGNFNLKNPCNLSLILDIELDKKTGNFVKGKILPFEQKPPGIPVYDQKNKSIILMQELIENYQEAGLNVNTKGIISKN